MKQNPSILPTYACLDGSRMSEGQFRDLLIAMVEGVHDHFGRVVSADMEEGSSMENYRRGALDGLAHQIACFCAQRYDDSVETGWVFEQLALDQDVLPAGRRKLVGAVCDGLKGETA